MAFQSSLRDGETISHKDLMVAFGMKTDRAVKEWIDELDIPYVPVNGTWWIACEDVRSAMRIVAQTHKQRRT